jgi:hypothetical protein
MRTVIMIRMMMILKMMMIMLKILITLITMGMMRILSVSELCGLGSQCRPNECIQGGALNRGLFFADPPLSLLGAVSGKISEIR